MGELLPGMNATAKITTASVKNVLALPNAALVRGSYVLVTKDSPSAANAETSMTAPDATSTSRWLPASAMTITSK